jgi:hypothetical protein
LLPIRTATSPLPRSSTGKGGQGRTTPPRSRGLVADARANLDYLIIPDDDTVTIVEKAVPHNYANLVLRRVKKGLLDSGDWKPIGEKFRISPQEAIQIYAKVR